MSLSTEEIYGKMVEMRMSNMAKKFQEMSSEPNFEIRNALEILGELISHEYSSRQIRRINKALAKAHLKYPAASIDESISDPDRKIETNLIRSLQACTWINDKKNLLIFGKAGTGKTYLGCALGISAIQKSKRVLYTKASAMINDLSECQFTGNYAATLKKYTDVDLLVIDDFGLMSLDLNKCLHLFEVLDAKEGSSSIMIISQLPPKKWYEMFQNNVYADACMSRLIHNAYRIELSGRDMRRSSAP